MAACEHCGREMKTAVGCTDEAYAEPHGGEGRCADCGAAEDGYHHPGCLFARCPECGDQAQACRMDGEHLWTVRARLRRLLRRLRGS